MNSTLKTLMVVMVAVLAFIGGNAAAATNWVPSGSATVAYSDVNLHPTLSLVKYDKPQVMVDGWLNLPAGFAVQVTEYAGTNDRDLDGDKGDEFDLAIWKKFALAEGGYVRLRLKYVNGYPVNELDGVKDAVAYDVFVGKVVKFGANIVTPELRAEYWNYLHDIDDGMITIVPSLSHEYQIGPRFGVYEQLGLQWNNDGLAPFGQLLSGQAKVGVKAKLSPSISWTVIECAGIQPLSHAENADPRKDGHLAWTSSVKVNF